MKTRRFGVVAALALTAALAAWLPGTAAGEPGRRGADRGGASDAAGDAAARVEQAEEAAERAGVERRDVRELLDLCERGEFDAAQTVRVLSLAAQLALEGLPVASFMDKIGEGVSKRADPDRILQAAERRALLLNQAKAILNGVLLDGAPVRDREELIPDVAAALEAGAPRDEVRDGLAAGFTAGESIGEIRKRIFP